MTTTTFSLRPWPAPVEGDLLIRDPLRLAILVKVALSDHEDWMLAAAQVNNHFRATAASEEMRVVWERYRAGVN